MLRVDYNIELYEWRVFCTRPRRSGVPIHEVSQKRYTYISYILYTLYSLLKSYFKIICKSVVKSIPDQNE